MSRPWHARLFRLARPALPRWNLAKTAAQVALFWFTFLAAIPAALVWAERAAGVPPFAAPDRRLLWAGLALASALGLWSGATMALDGEGTPLPLDAPRRLVARGPYRVIRNPMAVAGLSQGLMVAGMRGSWLTAAMVVAGALLWNYAVRPLEERHLAEQFGEAYADYRRAVRCWLPRHPGRTPRR